MSTIYNNGSTFSFFNGINVSQKTQGIFINGKNCVFMSSGSEKPVRKYNIKIEACDEDGKILENIVVDDKTPELKIDITCDSVGDISNVFGSLHVESKDASNIESTSGSVKLTGNCTGVKTVSGSISVGGSVSGNCSTVSGSIEAESIAGSCSSVSGSIKTAKRTKY